MFASAGPWRTEAPESRYDAVQRTGLCLARVLLAALNGMDGLGTPQRWARCTSILHATSSSRLS